MNMDMEKLSPTEMTRRIYEIIDQTWEYREVQSYRELMMAAYNLFGMLHFDFGVEFPPPHSPREANFDF